MAGGALQRDDRRRDGTWPDPSQEAPLDLVHFLGRDRRRDPRQHERLFTEAIRRAQTRRVEFLASIYEQLDVAPETARQLAVLAQAGMAVVGEAAPDLIPAGEQLDILRPLLTPTVEPAG